MSYIPNCRPKYEKDAEPFPYTKEEDVKENSINPYWYGLLTDTDSEFLRGYDWNVNEAICNFFDNLDVYAEDLDEVGIKVDEIDTGVVNGAKDTYNITMPGTKDERETKSYYDYNDAELESMSSSTKTMLLLKTILLEYLEAERDELVTSMIDGMDEDVYEQNLKEASDNENK